MNKSDAGKIGRAKADESLKKRWNESREIYYNSPKQCKNCQANIAFENKVNDFCNHSCAARYTNQHRARKLNKFCVGCNQALVHNRENRYNKYCDLCIKNSVYRGKKLNTEDCKTDQVRRRILLEKRLYQCEMCKLTEWNNQPIPLQVDHIDGNAGNNFEINLRLLCPNCHAQTPTFGSRNRGNGREIRRKRYAKYKAQLV